MRSARKQEKTCSPETQGKPENGTDLIFEKNMSSASAREVTDLQGCNLSGRRARIAMRKQSDSLVRHIRWLMLAGSEHVLPMLDLNGCQGAFLDPECR